MVFEATEGAHNPTHTENDMSKMIALAIVALSLATAAASAQSSAQDQNADTAYHACTTDEGYGRRTPCDVGGGG